MLAAEQRMRDVLDEHASRSRTLRAGTVAPAPLWRLTALMVERFPGRVLTSHTLAEAQVEDGILRGELDVGITLRPHSLPVLRSAQLMVENLAVCLPAVHPLAGQREVTMAQLDGEAFLLFSGIGVWREIVDRRLPHSELVVQEDRAVFEQLMRSTDLSYFLTDGAPDSSGQLPPGLGRVVVPIRDADAHATFYLIVRADAAPVALEVFEAVRTR